MKFESIYTRIILTQAFLRRYILSLEVEETHTLMTLCFIGSFVFFFLLFFMLRG